MIVVGDEVKDALSAGSAVVALESTIFSTLGLPSPANEEALQRCLTVIRSAGAVPALTSADGSICAGVSNTNECSLCSQSGGKRSFNRGFRNLREGATTVSASVVIADAVGIEVFATGGLVFIVVEITGDVSSDLGTIARHQVLAVSAVRKHFGLTSNTRISGNPVSSCCWLANQSVSGLYTRDSGL